MTSSVRRCERNHFAGGAAQKESQRCRVMPMNWDRTCQFSCRSAYVERDPKVPD